MRICFFGKPDSPQLRRVVKSLADRGHTMHVVYRGDAEVPGATYESFTIPPAGLSNPHRWRTRRERYLWGFLERFDVVSIQFLHSWGFTSAMMRAGNFTVRPWGSDIHPPPDGPQPPPDTIARRREMLQCAASVMATCNSFRDVIADYANIDASKIALTPLGVDLDTFEPPANPPAGPPVVGFLKGFGFAYGAPYLVRAIPDIVKACPNVRFEMVGDGPQLTECRRLANELNINSYVRWIPRLAESDVPATLARWSLSVIPSVTESFGIAALESSAMGVPVVASNVGGLPATVRDGETGLLVPSGNSTTLAEAIITLLQDESKRRRMGQQGRDFVTASYAWEDCMDTWEQFFLKFEGRSRRAEQLLTINAEQ